MRDGASVEGPSGDRNGEPAEGDWACILMVLVLVSIVAIIATALIGAALSDGPFSS